MVTSVQVVAAAALLCVAVAVALARLDFAEAYKVGHDIFDRKTYEWFIDECEGSVAEAQGSQPDVSDPVHVVYASDASEFPGLLSSMISLSRHAATPGDVVIHVVVQETDMYQAARLVDCFKGEAGVASSRPTVKLHQLRPISLNLSSFKEVWREVWPSGAPFLTPLTFLHMYLEEYVPEAIRIVWLDPDTIVRHDIGELYRTPMQTPVAAAKDSKWVTWRTEYEHVLNNLEPDLLQHAPGLDERILNSGVLVIDLERWRAEDLTSTLEALVTRTSGVKLSQMAFNLEFGKRFDELDWRWNVMGLMMVPPRRCIDEARILHWAGPVKHWSPNVSTRLEQLYEEVAGPYQLAHGCTWRETAVMLDDDVDIVPR